MWKLCFIEKYSTDDTFYRKFLSFLKIVQNLKNLKSGELDKLNIEVKKSDLKRNLKKGIF